MWLTGQVVCLAVVMAKAEPLNMELVEMVG